MEDNDNELLAHCCFFFHEQLVQHQISYSKAATGSCSQMSAKTQRVFQLTPSHDQLTPWRYGLDKHQEVIGQDSIGDPVAECGDGVGHTSAPLWIDFRVYCPGHRPSTCEKEGNKINGNNLMSELLLTCSYDVF